MNRVRTTLLPPVLAILFAALLCATALLISGASPLTALGAMVGQLGRGTTAVDTVNTAAIYYVVAIAVAIGFQMKLFNIGIEGQYRLAACAAAVVGGAVTLPPVLHALVIIAVGMLVGAMWAGIPALLKAYRGVSEVISTIMLNGVATGIIAFLIRPQAFGVLQGNNLTTAPVADSGRVPGLDTGAGTVFGLSLLAVVIGLGYWFLLNRTRFGFELRASGESPTAATAGGVDAKRMVIVALLLSGAIAGLAGLPELLGRDYAYTLNSPQGYGFTGIAIALLGRNHPVGIAFGALLWSFLDKSAVSLDNVGVARDIVLIMQGSVVLSVIVAYEIARRYELAAEQRRVAGQLQAAPAPGTPEKEPVG